jgi:hypothetical protein
MLNSNLKKNRRMFQQRYASILQSLHAPFLSEVAMPVSNDLEDKSPGSMGSLKSLASSGDSWAVLCTGGSSANHVSHLALPPAFHI